MGCLCNGKAYGHRVKAVITAGSCRNGQLPFSGIYVVLYGCGIVRSGQSGISVLYGISRCNSTAGISIGISVDKGNFRHH